MLFIWEVRDKVSTLPSLRHSHVLPSHRFGNQDVVTSYVLGPNFDLKKLRKDPTKCFFNMARAESPSSVAALEDNFEFVLQLVVTYADIGCFPPHSAFKVSLACLP